MRSWPVSRVLSGVASRDSHSSRPWVAPRLKQPTRKLDGPRQRLPIRSCSGWGLACRPCCHGRGELLPVFRQAGKPHAKWRTRLFTLTGPTLLG